MKRCLSFAFAIVALIASATAGAVITLTPLAGSTPQLTHPLTQYPIPIGVVATDDSGAGVQGLPVTFELYGPFTALGSPVSWTTVDTDDQGVATFPFPGVGAGSFTGTFPLTAEVQGNPDVVAASFELSIGGSAPTRVVKVSGDNQVSFPGSVFAEPFVIRLVDAAGAPVPYGLGQFDDLQPRNASGTFASQWVIGDANGLIVSPPFTAGPTQGTGSVIGYGWRVASATFDFTVGPPPPPPVTLSAIANSTPQSTRPLCYFPNPVGVIARNADGTPAPGVTVTFSSSDFIAQAPGEALDAFDVVTDAQGLALASAPDASVPGGYIAMGFSPTQITASSDRATAAVIFDLAIGGKPPTRVELLAGDGQGARVGGRYAPWIARAFDEDSKPVPYAAIEFDAPNLDGVPGATFEGGANYLLLAAGADGIAASPPLVANSVVGQGDLNSVSLVSLPDQYGEDPQPVLTNLGSDPGYGALRVWEAPPPSIAVAGTTTIPYRMMVLDASGNPAPGVPVTFTTDRSCATFAGSRAVTVNSGSDGIATSPLLTGTHPRVNCSTFATANGQTRDLTTHVFDPMKVVASGAPPYVQTPVDSGFAVELDLSEHGAPVETTQIRVRTHSLSGANWVGAPIMSIVNDVVRFAVGANSERGVYMIEIDVGAQRIVVPVLQGP